MAGDLDVDLDTAVDLLNAGHSDNDSGDNDANATLDIDVVDTDLLSGAADVELDRAESIVGDLDVDVGAAVDVLGDAADPVVNDGAGGTAADNFLADIGDGLSDLASEIVPGLNGGENAESDLTIDTDIDVLDENLADTDLDSVLDPAEEVLGDIDSDISAETDLFGSNEIHNAHGDSDIAADINGDVFGHDVIDAEADVPIDLAEHVPCDIDL